ncbi:MAG: AtpZ/AtpI family protein [Bacillota bacterium]
MKDNRTRNRWDQVFRGMAAASRIGINFATTIIGGFAIGYYLDKVLHTTVVFMMICTILGVAAAFRQLSKEFK